MMSYVMHSEEGDLLARVGKAKYHLFTPHAKFNDRRARRSRTTSSQADGAAAAPQTESSAAKAGVSELEEGLLLRLS